MNWKDGGWYFGGMLKRGMDETAVLTVEVSVLVKIEWESGFG